ncbi:MAG: hypothetical protein LBL90_00960 [Prevotellaceae bacterium]|jgi:hypothetical protein|nr:hypothetical protein [Prevotellaceae bacterium]
MKKILLSIIIIIFVTINGCAQQNKMKIEDIQEIWVYDYFNSKGYTQGAAQRKFQELENNKTAKIQLDPVFVDSLKSMLIYSAKHKKLPQGKYEQNLIFTQFILKDSSSRNIIIGSGGVYDDYRTGFMSYLFIDNSDKKNKTIWVNKFFCKLTDKINTNAD